MIPLTWMQIVMLLCIPVFASFRGFIGILTLSALLILGFLIAEEYHLFYVGWGGMLAFYLHVVSYVTAAYLALKGLRALIENLKSKRL